MADDRNDGDVTAEWVSQLADEAAASDHTPRPEFQRELRAELADSWSGTRPSRWPGERRGWVAAAAALLVVALGIGAYAVSRTDQTIRTSPPPTDPDPTGPDVTTPGVTDPGQGPDDSQPSPTDPPPTAPPDSGEVPAGLAERRWVITEVDGEWRSFAAHFEITTDGHHELQVRGHDGCNFYGGGPIRFDGDTMIVTDGTEFGSTAALCQAPYDDGWTAPAGSYQIDGDRLSITADDGRELDAVAYDSLDEVDTATLQRTWVTAEGLTLTFSHLGRITVPCATIGEWSFAGGSLATEIDQSADTSECIDLERVSLGWIFDALLEGSPTVRLLPDGSLLVGHDTLGRLFPVEQAPIANGAPVEFVLGGGSLAPMSPLATIGWGEGDGQLARFDPAFGVSAALLPDEVIVLEEESAGLLTGRGAAVDRASGAVRSVVVDDIAGGQPVWVGGAPDGTLYVATFHTDAAPQVRLRALREGEPGVFEVVDQADSEALGDSTFALTNRGVELGGELIVPSSAAADRSDFFSEGVLDDSPGSTLTQVLRYELDGTVTSWDARYGLSGVASELVADQLVPMEVAGRVVLDVGFLAVAPGGQSVHHLVELAEPGGTSRAWRLADGWRAADFDSHDVLLARATEAGVELAVLDVG